jgi:anti-anti-sigma factor
MLPLVDDPLVGKVVVDFAHTDYPGSTALGMLTRLFVTVRHRGGRLALCNVSDHQREVLDMVGLAGLWPVYSSREEALAAVAG